MRPLVLLHPQSDVQEVDAGTLSFLFIQSRTPVCGMMSSSFRMSFFPSPLTGSENTLTDIHRCVSIKLTRLASIHANFDNSPCMEIGGFVFCLLWLFALSNTDAAAAADDCCTSLEQLVRIQCWCVEGWASENEEEQERT